ncbi:MAG: HpcH/HpaI aldolase/citrate lyase family protein [Paracoccaceae bacterium]
MNQEFKPYRSLLYIPGSRDRALEKATTLPTDGIIFDLEDAVAIGEKGHARDLVAKTLVARDYGKRGLMVRVNALDSAWIMDDLAAICDGGPEAILLPKVNNGDDVRWLAGYLDKHPKCAHTAIWAMMESPLSILNARDIAASSPRLRGLVAGTNDLLKDLSARHTPDRSSLLTSLGLILLAGRAHGLICVDGVHNAYQDTETLRVMCLQGRDMGFDGKTLIHPAQIETANEVFSPSPEEIDLARRQMAAFDAAQARGEGIAVLDGNIVENLHVVAAKRLLAAAEAVEEMAT